MMQVLKASASKFFFCHRWGRTGTKGQAGVEGPFDSEAEASKMLADKFKEKTGNLIDSAADGSFAAKAGKYDLVKDFTGVPVSVAGRGGGCLWQYYVDDGVDGKPTGWYLQRDSKTRHLRCGLPQDRCLTGRTSLAGTTTSRRRRRWWRACTRSG